MKFLIKQIKFIKVRYIFPFIVYFSGVLPVITQIVTYQGVSNFAPFYAQFYQSLATCVKQLQSKVKLELYMGVLMNLGTSADSAGANVFAKIFSTPKKSLPVNNYLIK